MGNFKANLSLGFHEPRFKRTLTKNRGHLKHSVGKWALEGVIRLLNKARLDFIEIDEGRPRDYQTAAGQEVDCQKVRRVGLRHVGVD